VHEYQSTTRFIARDVMPTSGSLRRRLGERFGIHPDALDWESSGAAGVAATWLHKPDRLSAVAVPRAAVNWDPGDGPVHQQPTIRAYDSSAGPVLLRPSEKSYAFSDCFASRR
jgi:hypothetical protein